MLWIIVTLVLAIWVILTVFGDIVGWLANVLFASITIAAIYLLVKVIVKIFEGGKEQ